jgi:hypothetical protein
MKRQRSGSRSNRLKSRWPGALGWGFGLLLGVGALLGLALVQARQPAADGDVVSAVLSTLGKQGVAIVAAFAIAIAIAACFRRLWFEFLAYWPGPIVVREFVADRDLVDAHVARLSTSFRDQLANSRLQSPHAVPESAAQGNFLDVLGRGSLDATNPLASLVNVLRAAKPTHAYEVTGALVRRRATESCGVTVQVSRLPGKASPGRTFWDVSWDDAIRRAASHATACILPRTRACRSPWAAWRRYIMPCDLLDAYDRATELQEQRRYDEALDLSYAALQHDPLNLGLRLQIGFLQEKLALFLDAFDTYQGILEVVGAESPERRLPRRLSARLAARSYRRPARRERERVLLVARYRRAVLLGGRELHRQWCMAETAGHATERDRQNEQLRERLGVVLEDLFDKALGSSAVARLAAHSNSRQPQAEGSDERRRRLRALIEACPLGPADRQSFEELLILAGLRELTRLEDELPTLARPDAPLTRAAARVSTLCTQQRLRSVLRGPSSAELAHQPPRAAELETQLSKTNRRLLRRWQGRSLRRWQERYNAACVYALPLLDEDLTEDDRQALVARAVERLERACAGVDSGFLASRRDWVISEDPDLDGLRLDPAFKRFEVRYFPSAARTPRRPGDLHAWELSCYTRNLLLATAQCWGGVWRGRKEALAAPMEFHQLAEWCADEARAWEFVRRVSDSGQHWRTRFELIAAMRRWAPRYGFTALDVAVPRYAGPSSGNGDGWEHGDPAALEVTRNSERLSLLSVALRQCIGDHVRCELVGDLQRWGADLGRLKLTNRRVKRGQAAHLCDVHAALWLRLSQCLEDGPAAESDFREAVLDTARAWEDARARWRGGVPQSV